MNVIKAPNKVPNNQKIFLAGTIDMGNSIDWQSDITDHLSNCPEFKDYTILNPRRDDWDSSWVQRIDNPQFSEQVNWELEGLQSSDLVIFVFLPDSKSPVTMLELGSCEHRKSVVYCPYEFYRSGNIHIFCERYKIPYYTDYDTFKRHFTFRKFYRIGHIWGNQGLWYTQDGKFEGLIHEDEFSFCKCKDLKMDFDPEIVGWISVADSLNQLYEWFPKEDLSILQEKEFYIHEYEALDFRFYERFQHYIINQQTSKLINIHYDYAKIK